MPGQTEYKITPHFESEWNRIRHKVDTLHGDGVTNTPTSIAIGADSGTDKKRGAPTLALLKVISPIGSGTHRYNAKLLYGRTNNNPSTLQESDLGSLGNNQVELWSASEISAGGTLQNNSYYFGYLKGYNNSNGTPIYAVTTTPTGFIPLTVSQSGGSNGSASTAASYTYSCTNAITSTAISGGPYGPQWARPSGLVNAATHGTGFYDSSGTFHLWQVDETPQETQCG